MSVSKPIVYRQFDDDKFLLSQTKDYIKKFRNYFISVYKISCDNNKLVASVYLKSTFSNVFTNFEGFMV